MLSTVVLPIAIKLLVFVLGLLAVYYGPKVAPLIQAHVKNRLVADAFSVLATFAMQLVAATAGYVRDLKDPSKPGSWSPVMARQVKDAVLAQLRAMGSQQIALLQAHQPGVSVTLLLDHLVEASVEQLKRSGAAFNVQDLAGQVFLQAPGDAPAAPKASPGRASIGVLLVLAVLSAAATLACPWVHETTLRVSRGQPDPVPGCVVGRELCVTLPDTDGGQAPGVYSPSCRPQASFQAPCPLGCLVQEDGGARCVVAMGPDGLTPFDASVPEGGAW